jgi:hypothetical protein
MSLAEYDSMFEEATALAEAKQRMAETDSYQAALRDKYQRLHFWYAPPNGDQWPWDAARRPGKIHSTSNILKPTVDISARLEAKLPRITLPPTSLSEAERARAEVCEKSMMTWLEASAWKGWMHRAARTKHLYGKSAFHPFWNSAEKRPDVRIIENPANLRLGWGASDFTVLDWALYEYSLSPQEVMRRWKDVDVLPNRGRDNPLIVQRASGDHSDPLNQKQNPEVVRLGPSYSPSDYERTQVKVWDYWYKRDDKVYNCIILQETLHAVPPTYHREMPDIPYIPILNDFEPGSPEGISTIEQLLDLQEELNRAMSHWQQLVTDETDPAWQLTGDNNDTVPPGMVPKSGEIVAPGGGTRIEPISKSINHFPMAELIREMRDQYHMLSGLGEIAFGTPGSSQESGQALAVQMDAYNNRGEPRRDLFYEALHDLLVFWTIMVERLNPKVDSVDAEGNPTKAPLAPIFKNFRRWTIVAPELTPKDVQSHTNNEIAKMQAGVQSIRRTMDELGIDSPEDELSTISEENLTLALKPGFGQQILAVFAAMQQLQVQADQLAQSLGVQGSGQALAAANDMTGANNIAQQAQQGGPVNGTEDNQPGGAIPAAQTTQTTLVRSNPQGQGQTLNQIAVNRKLA